MMMSLPKASAQFFDGTDQGAQGLELLPGIGLIKDGPDDDSSVDGINVDAKTVRDIVHLLFITFDNGGNQGILQNVIRIQVPQLRENLQKLDDTVHVVQSQAVKIVRCIEGELRYSKAEKGTQKILRGMSFKVVSTQYSSVAAALS